MVFPAILWVYAALAAGAGAGDGNEPPGTQTVRDVLGREVLVPADWPVDRPLPVTFVWDGLPDTAIVRWERKRESQFLDDRQAEWEMWGFQDAAGEVSDSQAEVFAHAMRTYRDPGPTIAVHAVGGNDATDRWVSPLNMVADLDADGSLADEVRHYREPFARLIDLPNPGTSPHGRVLSVVRDRHRRRAIGYVSGTFGPVVLPDSPSRWWLDIDSPLIEGDPLPAFPRAAITRPDLPHSPAFADLWWTFEKLLEADGPDRTDRLPQIAATSRSLLDAELRLADAAITTREREVADQVRHEVRYRLGRALGYMELPRLAHLNLIKDRAAHDDEFRLNYYMLMLDVQSYEKDFYGPQFVLLTVRKLRREGRLGSALWTLQKLESDHALEPAADFWLRKKRRDLYRDLKWDAWAEYEHLWLWRKYPQWMWTLEYPEEAADLRGDAAE